MVLVVCIFLAVVAGPAAAETYYVSPDQSIQATINDANNGDTVIVQPGRYYENIDFRGKAITVQSTNPHDPNIVQSTIIDANGAGTVVTFANGENRDSVLQGFTIANGYVGGTFSKGGGIYCYNSSPEITDCIVTNCYAGYGGGTYCRGSEALIGNCTIIASSSTIGGGGVYCRYDSDVQIINCTISHNSSDDGGGIWASGASVINSIIAHNHANRGGGVAEPKLLKDSFIYSNTAKSGGGIYSGRTIKNNFIYNNSATGSLNMPYGGGGLHLAGGQVVSNNTFVANSAPDGGNLYFWAAGYTEDITIINNIIVAARNGGGISLECSAYVSIRFNDVWGNAKGDYYNLDGSHITVQDNISCDPLFVNPDANDYHLQVNSPCINAGDPAFIAEPDEMDIDDDPRVLAGRIDIGADEFSGNIKPVADAGDDRTFGFLPSSVILDGSDSFDPNGDTLTYAWQQTAGPTVTLSGPNAVAPTFVPLEFGTYVFEIVVNDGLMDSSPDTVGIVIGNNHAPVADAGLSRYAGHKSIALNGTGSFDPDGYGALTYQWRQISGTTLQIADANTATPTISGFTQTSSIQECEFELVVSDGDLLSAPDQVKVIIVPSYGGEYGLYHINGRFDPKKPTILAFGGGYDCGRGVNYRFYYKTAFWYQKANVMTTTGDWYSDRYQNYGDMFMVFLSARAPDYKQPIQTIGYSAGNGPAIDVANYINLTYADPRYAVNRVTLLDAACGDYPARVSTFLSSPVGGEPCLVDNYMATHGPFCPQALNVRFPTVPPHLPWDEWWGVYHVVPRRWYEKSSDPDRWVNADIFNTGITAGAYVSVVGPAKNLQLAPGSSKYYFKWSGEDPNDESDGVPDTLLFFDEPSYPGKLPQPVTLIDPADGDTIDSNGVVLTCQLSENAVGYQLLVGADPHRVMDFNVISDTPGPPTELITEVPEGAIYWTIKVRDQWGSTIYADPLRLPWLLTVDLGTLAKYWLNSCSEPEWCNDCDIDRDGIVNFIDFARFAVHWLESRSGLPGDLDGNLSVD
jgi:hypothetical protein